MSIEQVVQNRYGEIATQGLFVQRSVIGDRQKATAALDSCCEIGGVIGAVRQNPRVPA
jgi:hypothetical protein